jgi:hypothetical protein
MQEKVWISTLGFCSNARPFSRLNNTEGGFYDIIGDAKIKSLFAYKLRRLGVEGAIWQKSFYAFGIYSQEKCRQKLDYIHTNPVRKGIVDDPIDCRFSSMNFSNHMDVID